MNHIYRIVWNAASATLVAVCETARGRGKGGRSRTRRGRFQIAAPMLATGVLALNPLSLAFAQSVGVAAGSGLTSTYVAPNGVTVVDIDKANAAGLSHNRYTRFDVEARGLVLNNTTNSGGIAHSSQLAGQVMANMNAAQSARVILNEVVGGNRSRLAGFTEVLGGKADVVLANPYGITCSGCGFINTDRVTLTTGTPNLAADGALAGFTVNRGDILLEGTGLNASAQQILDLVARSVRLDGPVHAADLGISAGLQTWSYASRTASAGAIAADATPGWAIDSALLGGMYANRIRLVATEAGVGVRMLGDAAATAGDFSLDAAGRIELSNAVSATNDLRIRSGDAIAATDARMAAHRDISLASQGATTLTGGAIVAEGALAVQAASLIDTAGAATGGDSNARSAATRLQLTVADAAQIGATRWQSGAAMQLQAGSLTTGAGSVLTSGDRFDLQATHGDLTLGAATLVALKGMSLDAAGSIDVGAGTGQALQSRGGDLALRAGGSLSNAGAISADTGSVTVLADQRLHNAGSLHAAGSLAIAGRSGTTAPTVDNAGTLHAASLDLQGAALSNAAGARVQADASSRIRAASLSNAGVWLLSDRPGAADVLELGGALANAGTLQSGGSLRFAAGSLANTGLLLAADGIDGSIAAGLDNRGTVQAARIGTAVGGTLHNDATGRFAARTITLSAGTDLDNAGLIDAQAGDALLRVDGTLRNSATVQATGSLDIAGRSASAAPTVDNTGRMLAGARMQVRAADLHNRSNGWIQATTGSRIDAASIDNAGAWLSSTQASGGTDIVNAGNTFAQTGTLHSAQALGVTAGSLGLDGELVAAGALGVDLAGAARIGTDGKVSGASLAISAGNGLDQRGALRAETAQALLRVDASLANAGTIQAAGTLDIAARGSDPSALSIDNTASGLMLTQADLQIRAGNVVNRAGGQIQAATGTDVSATRIDNAGQWTTSTAGSAGSDILRASGAIDNSSRLVATRDLQVQAAAKLSNTAGATIQARGLQLSAGAGLDNAGTLAAAGGDLGMRVDGLLRNDGAIQATGMLDLSDRATSGSALDIVNGFGGEMLAGSWLIAQARDLQNLGGWIQADGRSLLKAATLTNQGTLLLSTGGTATASSAAVARADAFSPGAGGTTDDRVELTGALVNAGAIQSAHDLQVAGGDLTNQADVLASGKLALRSAGKLLNQSTGRLLAGAQLTAQATGAYVGEAGSQIEGAGVALQAGASSSHAGILSARSGNASLRVSGSLTNLGTVRANGQLEFADAAGTAAGLNLVNTSTGLIRADGLVVRANSVDNQRSATVPQAQGWIEADHATSIQAANLTNAGTWLLSTAGSAGNALTLSGALVNTGLLQSAGALTAQAASVRNDARWLVNGALNATTSGDLVNAAAATIYATGAASFSVGGLWTHATGATTKAASLSLTASGVPSAAREIDGTVQTSAGLLQLRLNGPVTNRGTLDAKGQLNIGDAPGGASQLDWTNRGTMLAGGDLMLNTGALDNAAGAGIQVGGTSQVQANALNNAGVWIAGLNDGATSHFTIAQGLANSATLQSRGAINASAASFTNAANARWIAGTDLGATLTGPASFVNAGLVQAGTVLGITGAASAVDNRAGASLLGLGAIRTDTLSLGNAGTIQGGHRTDNQLRTAQDLNNAGTITLASAAAGDGTIDALGIVNTGSVQSLGGLALTLGSNGLTQSGTLVSDGAMRWNARSGQSYGATLSGASRTQTAGSFDAQGFAQITALDAALLRSGTQARLNGTRVDLGSRSVIYAGGALDLAVDALTLSANGSDTSRILGSMDPNQNVLSRISVSQPLRNDGLLFSRWDLQLSAPQVNNVLDRGGIAALNNLTITATGGDVGAAPAVDNAGALYAGGKLTVSADRGTIRNRADASRYQGTIDGNDIELRASTLHNNSTVNAVRDLTVDAEAVLNEHVQASSRTTTQSPHTKVQTGYGSGTNFPDKYEWWSYKETWSDQQTFVNGEPSRSVKPWLIAGRNLDLAFNAVKNAGGVISAPQVNLHGRSGYFTTPIFLNDPLDLIRTDYTRTYTEHTLYIAAGPAKYHDRQLRDDVMVNASTTTFSLDAGVFAGTLTGNNFALTNAGSPSQKAPTPFNKSTAAGSAGTAGTAASDNTLSTQTSTQHTITLDGQSRTADGVSPALTRLARSAQSASDLSVLDANAVAANTRPKLPPPPLTFASYNATQGIQGTSFGGITAQLPTNPNGYFVAAKSSQASYKVEANPLYMVGSSSLGSDYLYERLGFDPEQMSRRLGDANYEAQLVRQQLVAQTGNVVLAGFRNIADQMQALMDNAAQDAAWMGLQFGKALTPAQQSMLDSDIVWMVQSEIDGESLLVPVVYLSPATKAGIVTGAVISAENAHLSLSSLTNTGGTIVGSKNLVVAATGDIKNLSGLIKGGNVSLTSTEGSIVNETFAQSSGNERFMRTEIGKTAGIESTGTLALDAKKDIRNIGAQITAGTDASIKAGRDIVFDTIEKKTIDTSASSSSGIFSTQTTTTTTSKVEQVKSGLTVGGNLAAKAGRDITFAGTDVKVGGDADVDAANNLNIIARENRTSTQSKSTSSGAFQNGALYSSSETTTDSLSVRNVGSTFTVGGNAQLHAGKDVTIQGSDLKVAGSGGITADGDIKVLAGRNYDATTVTTTTTRIGTADLSSGTQAGAGAQAGAAAGAGRSGKVDGSAVAGSAQAGANAGAGAQADGSATGELTLASTTTTTTTTTDLRNVGSTISFGGDMKLKAKDVTLQGAKVHADGDVDVDAQNVRLLAAEDRKTSSTTTTTTRVGLMASSDNNADASANAWADSQAQGSASGRKTQASGNASAEAGAQAGATAATRNSLDLVRTDITTEETLQTRNQGSTLSSGGSMKIKAANEVRLEGSSVEAGQDLDVSGRKITSVAVADRDETRTSHQQISAGLYLDAQGSAGAQASAKAEAEAGASKGTLLNGGKAPGSAQAGVSAEAEAKGSVEVGVQARYSSVEHVEGSTTAVTSSFKSGGNMRRTATESITDQGTAIEAGGNYAQSAKTITSLAAENTSYSSTNTRDASLRVGAFAQGEAKAGAGAQASTDGDKNKQTESGASGGAGARVRASYGESGETSSSTTAVVSTIKVGGNFSSSSSGTTTLQGTQVDAGKDVTLKAGKLDFQAAADTTRESAGSREGSIDAKGDVLNKSVSVDAGYGSSQSSASTSTAVVGSIRSGGATTLSSSGDMRLEGTQIDAGGPATLKADGKLSFDAARNTSTSQSDGLDLSLNVTAAKKSGGGTVGVEHSMERTSSSEDVAGGVRSSGKLTIQSGSDMSFTGTQLAGSQGVDIGAGGNVSFKAAETRESSQSLATNASVTASASKDKGKSSKGGAADVSVEGSFSESTTQTGGSISSDGGAITIRSGGNASFTGTAIDGNKGVEVDAKGSVRFDAARDTQTSTEFDVGIKASGSQEKGSSTERKKNEDGSRTTTRTKTESTKGEASAAVGAEHESSSQETGGSISSAGGAIRIKSGGDASFTGTEIAGDKGVQIAAGGDLNFEAARSTSSSQGGSLSVGASGGQSTENKSEGTNAKDGSWERTRTQTRQNDKSGQVSGEVEVRDAVKETGVKISSGSGGISLSSGGDTKLVGTEVAAAGTVNIAAGGSVVQKDTVNQSVEASASFGASGSNSTTRTDTTTDGKGKAAQTETSRQREVATAHDGDVDADVSRSSKSTAIQGGAGVVITQGAAKTVQASVPLPAQLPAGKSVVATTADGQPLPSWLKFDPKSGTFEGKPPADFQGTLKVVVGVPQADGSVRQIPMDFGAR